MKLIVYGSKGWIGTQFINLLQKNNVNFIIGNSRSEKSEDVLNEIKQYKVTHIVSFIGRTSGIIGDKKFTTIDYLEQPGKLYENIKDNLFFGSDAVNIDAIDLDNVINGLIEGNKIYDFNGYNSDGIDIGEASNGIAIHQNLIYNSGDN